MRAETARRSVCSESRILAAVSSKFFLGLRPLSPRNVSPKHQERGALAGKLRATKQLVSVCCTAEVQRMSLVREHLAQGSSQADSRCLRQRGRVPDGPRRGLDPGRVWLARGHPAVRDRGDPDDHLAVFPARSGVRGGHGAAPTVPFTRGSRRPHALRRHFRRAR